MPLSTPTPAMAGYAALVANDLGNTSTGVPALVMVMLGVMGVLLAAYLVPVLVRRFAR